MKFVLLFTVMYIFCISIANSFDKTGMVLYLRFDEGSGETAKDSSAGKNDGNLQGNVTWVDGKYGRAVKINDDKAENMVVVKDNASLDIIDQITICAWVYMETLPDGNCSLITKADTYMIHQSNWSGKGIEQELLIWPFDAWQTAASTPIQFNEWYHVLGTYDGKNIKMYVNGELKGSRPYASKIATTNNDVVIGRDSRTCCNTRRAAQTLDEVMIFNRSVSDKDVKEIMSGGGVSVEPQERLAISWGQIKF